MKIIKFSDIETIRRDKIIVLCCGVFDVLHIGHIQYLKEAKTYGEVLVIVLTDNKNVNKGPHRPIFSQEVRAEMLSSLEFVDYVILNEYETAVEVIENLQPEYYVKGPDYLNSKDENLLKEKSVVEKNGGELVFTNGEIHSSSSLINKNFSNLSPEVNNFLNEFKSKFSINNVLDYIEKLSNLKVLIIGEVIIDRYVYCNAIGKSGKEPILAFEYKKTEDFFGGSLAVAKHVKNFCNIKPFLMSYGNDDDVPPKLGIYSIVQNIPGSYTIKKERIVQDYPFQKIIEIYHSKPFNQKSIEAKKFKKDLKRCLNHNYDLVIVTDYGHGMIDDEMRDILIKKNYNYHLAVNTQANAGNYGFNTISKYRNFDYGCISRDELLLDIRQKKGPEECLERTISETVVELKAKRFTVTQGSQGLITYSEKEGFYKVPAFTSKFVDRVGSGDAVFAITSMLSAIDAPKEVIGFVGSVVGAMAVDIVGNSESISKNKMINFITSILK